LSLTQFVPLKDPLKISRLTVRNVSKRARRLSVTAYAEWVLGSSASATAPTIITAMNAELGLITARNAFHPSLPGAVAFLDIGGGHSAFTADRGDFVGRHGGLKCPQALCPGMRLNGRSGAGLDP